MENPRVIEESKFVIEDGWESDTNCKKCESKITYKESDVMAENILPGFVDIDGRYDTFVVRCPVCKMITYVNIPQIVKNRLLVRLGGREFWRGMRTRDNGSFQYSPDCSLL